jgi:hypothetical protein
MLTISRKMVFSRIVSKMLPKKRSALSVIVGLPSSAGLGSFGVQNGIEPRCEMLLSGHSGDSLGAQPAIHAHILRKKNELEFDQSVHGLMMF